MSPQGYETLIKIQTDIFLMEASDFQKGQVPLQSPRVRNVQYKPVFCFVYFLITYFMLKKRMSESHTASQHSLQAINITVGGEITTQESKKAKSPSKERLPLPTVVEKPSRRSIKATTPDSAKGGSPNKSIA
jgi:hypothetical protein